MPKKILLLSFTLLLFYSSTLTTSANCYYIFEDGYAVCAGGIRGSSTMCGIAPSFYACCNNYPVADDCPPINTPTPLPPGVSTPTPTPGTDCGDTSEPCCPQGKCNTPDLYCVSIQQAGFRCISLTTCKMLPGGCPVTVGNNIFCDPSGKPTSVYDKDHPNNWINTSLGCFPFLPQGFASAVIGWGVRVGGGLSFFTLLYGALVWITGTGDPKKIQAGKELVSAALSGLLLIALSLTIINAIGTKILNLGPLGFFV